MARDLIPPPSPAGRPGSSAEAERERARELEEQRQKQKGGLWHRSPEDEATTLDSTSALVSADPDAASGEARDLAGRPQPTAPTPFRSRFGLMLGALLGLGIAALAIGAAVYVGSTGNGAPSGWSGWKPTADDGEKAAQQIATHVGRKYRLADGNQLVGVQGGPLEIDALGLTVPLEIAMKTAPQGGDIDFIKGKGLMYTLNGLGPKGSVRGGKPSPERHLLLRREALEVALYSFHYLDGIEQIVVFMPPRKGQKPNQAFFIRKGDLGAQLDRPLTASLAPRAPTTRDVTLSPDVPLVQRLTLPNLFTFSLTQANTDNRGFIVLDPLPAASASPAPAPRSSGRS
jgi:hypothetical protein